MKNLKLVRVSDIKNYDIIDNISEETLAILIDEDDCWIEVRENGYFVSDWFDGNFTTNILEAVECLQKFKQDNSI